MILTPDQIATMKAASAFVDPPEAVLVLIESHEALRVEVIRLSASLHEVRERKDQRIVELIQRVTAEPPTCIWDYDDFLCSWDTACQNCFTFIDLDGPKENGMDFCCYCGKKLVEAPRDEDVDKADTDEVE